MKYDQVALPDAEVAQAIDPTFQHLVTTYASETNKTTSLWRAIPEGRANRSRLSSVMSWSLRPPTGGPGKPPYPSDRTPGETGVATG